MTPSQVIGFIQSAPIDVARRVQEAGRRGFAFGAYSTRGDIFAQVPAARAAAIAACNVQIVCEDFGNLPKGRSLDLVPA